MGMRNSAFYLLVLPQKSRAVGSRHYTSLCAFFLDGMLVVVDERVFLHHSLH